MRIDFSTIKEFRIPEGVVTQIADASGRVLWMLDTEPKIAYLRPSADKSYGTGLTLVPAGSEARYLLVNEEVADGYATYINVQGSVNSYVEFELSGLPNEKITKIMSICIGMQYNSNATGSAEGELTEGCRLCSWCGVNGVEYAGTVIFSSTSGLANIEVPVDSAIIEVINQHIVANGMFPTLTLRLNMSVVTPEGKSSYSLVVSQAYVVFEYK